MKIFKTLLIAFMLSATTQGVANVNKTNNAYDNEPNCMEIDGLGCQTVTIGINVFFAYVETTVTICCTPAQPLPGGFSCTTIDAKGEAQNSIIYDLTDDISKAGNADKNSKLDKIEVVKSSTVSFNGKKIQIKKGTYQVSKNNTVNLEYVLVD